MNLPASSQMSVNSLVSYCGIILLIFATSIVSAFYARALPGVISIVYNAIAISISAADILRRFAPNADASNAVDDIAEVLSDR